MTRPLGSLRARVFAATGLVAVAPIAAALLVVGRGVSREAHADLAARLEEAVRLVQQTHRARLELAAERATLVADLPKLKAAVHEADPRTVEPIAREYREQVRSDVFVVADRSGRTLVAVGSSPARWMRPATGARVDAGRLLETVQAPIQLGTPAAPEHLGELTLGFALDHEFAARLAALTGAQVAVVHQGRVFASTLPRGHDAQLVRAAQDGGAGTLELAGESFVAARAPLGDEAQPVVLVLRSQAEVLAPLRRLRGAVTAAALGAVAFAVLLSWAVARTVTRPLAALTATMREIARTGDLGRPLAPPQPWDDEDAKLLGRALGTLTASVARFQKEAAQRERLSALGRLSTVIAHEIRNPLMIIKGSLRSLKREGAPVEEVREAAADIEQEVARLNRVVGDVLDFARPLRVEPAPVDLRALAADALQAGLEHCPGVRGRVAVEPPAASLVTDGERLRSVLVNLVENAREAVLARQTAAAASEAPAVPAGPVAPEGEPDVVVGAVRLASGDVRVWVEDGGSGIAEADLARVFEPYYTTRRTGTGLGLAIARKVVEALGGTIRVRSREGEGTRVEIELPSESRPTERPA